MTFVLADRVKETTDTVGTGTLSLNGPVTDFRAFTAAVGNNNTCYYCAELSGGDEWEVGIGTVRDGDPDTLERDTVLSSSNAGGKVPFSAGEKEVFVVYPAGRAVYRNDDERTTLATGLTIWS